MGAEVPLGEPQRRLHEMSAADSKADSHLRTGRADEIDTHTTYEVKQTRVLKAICSFKERRTLKGFALQILLSFEQRTMATATRATVGS